MKKISRHDTKEVFLSQRSIVAEYLGISRYHAGELIEFGDRSSRTRRNTTDSHLSGYQFSQYVAFLEQEGFSTTTALCAARNGIGRRNHSACTPYYYLVDGLLVDHEELKSN